MIDLANIFNHLEGWSKQEVYRYCKYEKAAEMLQYALNSNPSDAFACLTLGKMCHDIGKHENVALFLEQAIKCDSI